MDEVMIWPHGRAIAALASKSKTFEYAPDGLDFYTNRLKIKMSEIPHAPGAYREDLANPKKKMHGIGELAWWIMVTRHTLSGTN